ncbi:hypothetical protein BT63DRAFT_430106 [Microthyrium microscopicum]|uniref:Uncharacterized protein n=1 Tax=Microthyrium microscopicum TaxID=703497 RepID=A0A6A6TVN1_9PEZI|nr:hypothetical protein BT63DRAFT_430106 [Microthyrium microscopicum]
MTPNPFPLSDLIARQATETTAATPTTTATTGTTSTTGTTGTTDTASTTSANATATTSPVSTSSSSSSSSTSSTATASPSAVPEPHSSGLSGLWIAIIVAAVLGLTLAAGLFFFRRRAAQRRAFGSAPGPSLDGARAGLSSLWYKMRNPRERSQGAGFEGISAGRAGNTRGAGRALDPDEAWDSRVGGEADMFYGDTELHSTAYHGGSEYAGTSRGGMPVENPFGDEHAQAGQTRGLNPFGDEHAEAGMRPVSPRPVIDTSVAGGSGPGIHASPTRRSLFKEEM